MSDLQPTATSLTNVGDALDNQAGQAQKLNGVSLQSFVASLGVAAAIFTIEMLLFLILRKRLQRVYEPRTFLVPQKRRTTAPASGIFDWIPPLFHTANSDFINSSGLDAYFFLRYLRMLLKIFVVMALAIIPILLPINIVYGRGSPEVNGMDQLAWGNINTNKTSRYWAHCLLCVMLVCWICYNVYKELRNYVRLRQAYLSSPQHRMRASATTVLISSIPRKWLSTEGLDSMFDVFPGGIRNIWINRDYSELQDKVQERDKLARKLEAAETALVRKCKKADIKKKQQEAKKNKKNKTSKEVEPAAEGSREEAFANSEGISSGNPYPEDEDSSSSSDESDLGDATRQKSRGPLGNVPILGEGLGFVKKGFGGIKRGLERGVDGVQDGFKNALPQTSGFDEGGEEYAAPPPPQDRRGQGYTNGQFAAAQRQDVYSGRDHSGPVRPSIDEAASPGVDTGPREHTTVDRAAPNGNASINPATAPEPEEMSAGQTPKWMFWKKKDKRPGAVKARKRTGDHPKRPLTDATPVVGVDSRGDEDISEKVDQDGVVKASGEANAVYPAAYNKDYKDDDYGEPVWKRYIDEKDRETMRLPPAKWMPFSLPFLGEKVDIILYCRKEVARLNVEIEADQQNPTRFPLMNSAFIQFNNQIAAHMACQSLSHHVPENMTPRIVEVSPDDVIWANMRIKWWEGYIRTAVVTVIIIALVVGWAFPVAFVGLFSQVAYLASIPWLAWIAKLPQKLVGTVAGVLPPLFLAILMALLPVVLRMLARLQGAKTGSQVEIKVQRFYFAFLFVQVFLVVSISAGITTVFKKLAENPLSAPSLLAQNLPRASNFFLSYLLLQAFAQSGGAILQIGTLIAYFLLAPILDSTARQKWLRQTNLMNMSWGSFFPVYTNLACIGIIYSIISPIILLFNIFTFSLFWVVYRYNLMYVCNYRNDTGGLLFPRALNQLFTGVYIMLICLVGLFFLVRDVQNRVACLPQAIVMIIMIPFVVIFQVMVNSSFGPLFKYLPISLEDDAVERDKQYYKENYESLMHPDGEANKIAEEEQPGDDLNKVLQEREEREKEAERAHEEYEMEHIENKKRGVDSGEPSTSTNPIQFMRKGAGNIKSSILGRNRKSRVVDPETSYHNKNALSSGTNLHSNRQSAHLRDSTFASDDSGLTPVRPRARDRSSMSPSYHHHRSTSRHLSPDSAQQRPENRRIDSTLSGDAAALAEHLATSKPTPAIDLEAQEKHGHHHSHHNKHQHPPRPEFALFDGLNDQIEDLTPDERDDLVGQAFQHEALRAKRPVVWIPRDDLGVSDDEIYRTQRFSKNVWISNEYAGLDFKGRVVFRRGPPDFDQMDLIEL